MIALEGIQGPRELLSEELPATEIYEGLLRYRGRTVRVQESSIDELKNPPAKRGEAPTSFESRFFSDQLGILSGLKLQYSGYFYSNGEESSGEYAYFTLLLDGTMLENLTLHRARIQVFQEDTGNWEVLFQGSAWTDFDKNYLRIYS